MDDYAPLTVNSRGELFVQEPDRTLWVKAEFIVVLAKLGLSYRGYSPRDAGTFVLSVRADNV